ncbi:hypothetical protein [Thiothrix nivea]|uniref:hypothetical protein n=1 Tax=Thiothrix nivea TaxID=1031 RepID=UPI000593C4D0|nr:hypothetical protein [Thiothrix nivea]
MKKLPIGIRSLRPIVQDNVDQGAGCHWFETATPWFLVEWKGRKATAARYGKSAKRIMPRHIGISSTKFYWWEWNLMSR